MSTKAATSSPAIALPKGGGALTGIGETFSPDLHTGTGNFSVPIALPPGRHGFQPELSLRYSSGSGNGPFGLGWGLNMPSISRKTSRGLPRYDEAIDTFIFAGAEDLVPVASMPTCTYYRPRTEGLFARIMHVHSADDNYWEVRTTDGRVDLYGTPRPTTAPATWRDPASVADPDRPEHIFTWQLTRTTDPSGNRIEYSYERDQNQADGPHRWDHPYLSQIRYVDYGDPASPQFLVTVNFGYEQRPDPFSSYRAGFEIRTVRRCSRIQIASHAGKDVPIRTYHFDYLDERGLPLAQMPANGVSLLSRIRVQGHDGESSEWLPPLEFGYTAYEPAQTRYQPLSTRDHDAPARSIGHGDYALVDLFGSGLPDVVQMNGTARYWRNLGGGMFDVPRTMTYAPADVNLSSAGVQLADMNGDGRSDLLVTDGVRAGYYALSQDGGWDRRSYVGYRKAPTMSLADPDVRLVDLNGDGVIDALRTGPSFELYYNDPDHGWEALEPIHRGRIEAFSDVSFSDHRVKLADMSGDGLQDLVLVHNGRVDYWPYRGYGRWSRRITMHNSPRFEDGVLYGGIGYDPRRVLLGDVDGDGLADLVYVGDGHLTLWFNQSGNGWSDPITIHGTPDITDLDAVRLADMHGTGTSGILWTYDYGAQRDSRYKFLDLTGGNKPYLLNRIDNHTGAVTLIAYASSTSYYLADEHLPETRWKTTLPFPVQVVARVEVLDAISRGKLTTEYSYHHGYWDGVEREFRGFARVDQRDTETFEDYNGAGLHDSSEPSNRVSALTFSPPTETRTWFHLGPVENGCNGWQELELQEEYWPGDAPCFAGTELAASIQALPSRDQRDGVRSLRGRVLRTELYALDGTARQARPYTITEYQYGLREEQPPPAGDAHRSGIFFPYASAQRTTHWERGNDPMTSLTFIDDYDAYGQPRTQTSVAVPRGRDYHRAVSASEPYLATHTVTEYAQRDDDAVYIVDRTCRTTAWEVVNSGTQPASALAEAVGTAAVALRLIGQTLNFYDGLAFTGLPCGQLGDRGVLTRTERLVTTAALLHDGYRSGDRVSDPPEEPPYLARGTAPAWTPEYPQAFQAALADQPPADPTRPGLAITTTGYGFAAGSPDAPFAQGYFAASERRSYDFQERPDSSGRGLVIQTQDPLGHASTITYDTYGLLPTSVRDPVGLETTASYDYRVFQATEITDPNGNSSQYAFTPLGLLAGIAVLGKDGGGDTPNGPSIRFAYHLTAVDDGNQPISVRTIKRVHHATAVDVDPAAQGETIETVEYSDGFGRLLQTRTQAEDVAFGDPASGDSSLPSDQSLPTGDAIGQSAAIATAPRVVVSGWQVYDNKGRVVEKYEPAFSAGFEYEPELVHGQKGRMFYDPRGRVVRTVNPDGSETRVVRGVPGSIATPDLAAPDVFEPTPWQAYTYDTNDNAGRTHRATSQGYDDHWNTPTSTLVDALGRLVRTVERNGADPDQDWYTTESTYDIQGNILSVTDALGRTAFQHVYDLSGRALRDESIDGGVRRTVHDAAGNIIEYRDGKGALALHAYDPLHRLVRLWARDTASGPITVRQRLEYGDGGDAGQPEVARAASRATNLLGRLQRQYDEAGVLSFESYDFKGNVLEKVRQVIGDSALLGAFSTPPADWQLVPYAVDWESAAGTGPELDASQYRVSLAYDALNRVTSLCYPQDVDGAEERHTLWPRYSRSGALESVELAGSTYVERIAYNARGQQTLIAYGNGLMTRYAYDPQTFRLARLCTERYSHPAPLTYHPAGQPLQDFIYAYDLAGNVLAIHDRAPGSGLPAQPDELDRVFSYDPLYRLLTATGRECDTPPTQPWDPGPRCTDLTRTRGYAENYAYDPVGNLTRLRHASDKGGFARELALVSGRNQLDTLTVGGDTYAYDYDPNGNVTAETSSRHFEWDYADRMRVYRTQTERAEPTVYAQYLYDASGQRVKKLVRKQGGRYEVAVYVDGVFEHRRMVTAGGDTQQHNVLHVLDNQSRIALVRVGPPFPDDTGPAIQYHLGDHLGSSHVVVDDRGDWTNREEYTPYGETSFGSFARKRYRYTGKERDGESGLYYHGARYYAPWLARWVSCDPAGTVDGLNLYAYVRSNPARLVDRTGHASGCVRVLDPKTHRMLASSGCASTTRTDSSPRQSGRSNPRSVWEGLEGAVSSSAEAVAEGAIWDPAVWGRLTRQELGAIVARRGNILEYLAGNNPLQGGLGLAKDADRITSTTVVQMKSTIQLNRVGQIVRDATRDAADYIKANPTGAAGRAPQAQLFLRTGTKAEVVDTAENALVNARKAIPGAAAPEVTTGLPGVLGAVGKVATVAGGAYSAYSLYGDVQRRDVAAGVGDAAGVASSGTTLAAGALGSTALATTGSVTGAFAIGYGIGTVMNKYLIEPLIDKAAPGSGAVGEWYYKTFLK